MGEDGELLMESLLMEACSSQPEYCSDKEGAQMLKIVAVFLILLGCILGVSMPILGKSYPPLRPESSLFFVLKAFAAGVILATGFMHMLPDAFEALGSPCLLESPHGSIFQNFPFAGFIAMMSALLTLFIEFSGSAYYHNHAKSALPPPSSSSSSAALPTATPPLSLSPALPAVGSTSIVGKTPGPFPSHHYDEEHGNPHAGKHHLEAEELTELSLRIRHRIVSQVLELGIVSHSIIIGIALGASNSPCTIRPLVVALTFHQFFEGIALGGCIAQAGFKRMSTIMMAIFFCITTPIGIGIGMAISSTYNENSPRALIVQGVLDSISSGILLYMSLVDLIATEFLSERLRESKALQMFSFTALFLGTGAMSLIAKWS